MLGLKVCYVYESSVHPFTGHRIDVVSLGRYPKIALQNLLAFISFTYLLQFFLLIFNINCHKFSFEFIQNVFISFMVLFRLSFRPSHKFHFAGCNFVITFPCRLCLASMLRSYTGVFGFFVLKRFTWFPTKHCNVFSFCIYFFAFVGKFCFICSVVIMFLMILILTLLL